MTRKGFLKQGAVAAGALVLAQATKAAHAEEAAKAPDKAPPKMPPPSAIHFKVLKSSDYDSKRMYAALQVKKPHKFVYQSVTPHVIIPGLSSLYIHIQNSLNAGEFSFGWGRGNVASAAVLYGPSVTLALNDAMWAKYPFGEAFNMKNGDGKGETRNVYYPAQTSMGFDGDPGAGGNVYQDWSGEACIKRGTAFMVCHNALTAFAGIMSMQMGLDGAQTLAEWKANMLPGYMIVPAGVGAIHLAQENGWKLLPLI
jgi:hypothetical protein